MLIAGIFIISVAISLVGVIILSALDCMGKLPTTDRFEKIMEIMYEVTLVQALILAIFSAGLLVKLGITIITGGV